MTQRVTASRRGFGLGIFMVLGAALLTAIFVGAYYRYSLGLARERALASLGLVASNVARSAIDEALYDLFARANMPGEERRSGLDIFRELRSIEAGRSFSYVFYPEKTRSVFTDPGVQAGPVQVRVRYTTVSSTLVRSGVRRISLWPPPRICSTLQITYRSVRLAVGLVDFECAASAGGALPAVKRTAYLRKQFTLVELSRQPALYAVNISPINLASGVERSRGEAAEAAAR